MQIKANQQECFRLSNCFILTVLAKGQLTPVWWPTYGVYILNGSRYISLVYWRRRFLITFLYWCIYTLPNCYLSLFFSTVYILKYFLCALCSIIFHRRSFHYFLCDDWTDLLIYFFMFFFLSEVKLFLYVLFLFILWKAGCFREIPRKVCFWILFILSYLSITMIKDLDSVVLLC